VTLLKISVVWPAAGALAITCGSTAAEPGTYETPAGRTSRKLRL
jgi:hypothetical protein